MQSKRWDTYNLDPVPGVEWWNMEVSDAKTEKWEYEDFECEDCGTDSSDEPGAEQAGEGDGTKPRGKEAGKEQPVADEPRGSSDS